MLPDDPLRLVLTVDMTRKRFRVDTRPDLFGPRLGGAGAAIRLLEENCPAGCDPLGPSNAVVLAVGPLTGLFPLASKTTAFFKSPHTGNLGESHAGGRSAVAIRMAGYGAIVITGASERPVTVAIHGDAVTFRDATTLWGMRSSFTAGRVLRRQEPREGMRALMRIGRAGENLVTWAGVTTETYRHFGRLGLGAVFGSKKLKALAVSGRRSLPVTDGQAYRRLYDEIFEAAVDSPVMRKYHELGTPQNVVPLDRYGGLPTRNLQAARFEAASAISGEAFAERYLGRRLACAHCPVACVHVAALREAHPSEPYFCKTSMISYDYEPIYAMGPLLGVGDPEGLLRLLDEVEAAGLDVMSAGPVLAWATEAREKGLVGEKETGGLKLVFGDVEAYIEAIRRITSRANPFYDALARGVDHAAAVYGGTDFALAFGGNEMPGYHTGPASHLGYLVGARHSHLDNAGYGVDQKIGVHGRLEPAALAGKLVAEESWRQILSSLVACFFARGIYTPDVTARALASSGIDLDAKALDALGTEILREKYRFKIRQGFSLEGIRIPRRIFETPATAPGLEESYLREALAAAWTMLAGDGPSSRPQG